MEPENISDIVINWRLSVSLKRARQLLALNDKMGKSIGKHNNGALEEICWAINQKGKYDE